MAIKKDQSIQDYIDEEIIADRTYSDSELKKFHDLVQNFYVETGLLAGKKLRVLNLALLKVAYGACGKRGGIILENIVRDERNNSIRSYKKPTRLAELENLLEQWQGWKIRTGLDMGHAEYTKLDQTISTRSWKCPHCNSFEGSFQEVIDHKESCSNKPVLKGEDMEF